MREVEAAGRRRRQGGDAARPERELLRARPARRRTGSTSPTCSRSWTRCEGIERIRYTSPHPKDVREKLVAAHAELPSLCEHIHLPLQSGSSRILKAMRRTYDRDRYMKRVEMIRASVPDCAITTDIIVGFPGETEDGLPRDARGRGRGRLRLRVHVRLLAAPRAPRRPTLPDQVPHAVKRERMERLVDARPAPRARAQQPLRRHRRRRCWSRARAAPTPRGCAGARATTRRSTSRASRSRATSRRCEITGATSTTLSGEESLVAACLPDVVAIFGPTGVGKTEIAVELAELLRARARTRSRVSADAIAVYEGLDVLAAKPTPASRTGSSTGWSRACRSTRSSAPAGSRSSRTPRSTTCWRPGRRPIVVGGTGLYLRAALTELDLRPPPEPDLRARARAGAGRGGARPRCTAGCRPPRRRRCIRTTASGSCGRSSWS